MLVHFWLVFIAGQLIYRCFEILGDWEPGKDITSFYFHLQSTSIIIVLTQGLYMLTGEWYYYSEKLE